MRALGRVARTEIRGGAATAIAAAEQGPDPSKALRALIIAQRHEHAFREEVFANGRRVPLPPAGEFDGSDLRARGGFEHGQSDGRQDCKRLGQGHHAADDVIR